MNLPIRYAVASGGCPEHGETKARLEDWGRLPDEHIWTAVCPICDAELLDVEWEDVRDWAN